MMKRAMPLKIGSPANKKEKIRVNLRHKLNLFMGRSYTLYKTKK
jgi:hypothetical protein